MYYKREYIVSLNKKKIKKNNLVLIKWCLYLGSWFKNGINNFKC